MTTFRIETSNRWDAIALTKSLRAYHWYLIEPDAQHWDVNVALDESQGLPDDLRRRIEAWLRERHLEATTVRADGLTERVIAAGG
jgi:hypothetical protein